MTNQNPWITVWTEPRDTIRRIIAENPKRSLWLLAAIYGFSSLLNSFQSGSLGASISIVPLFLLALILAPFWGYLVFSFWSIVVVWTGKIFKGQGNFQTVRAAYAWSCVPLAVTAVLWILLILFFGHSLFTNFPREHLLTGIQTALLFCILIAKVAMVIWTLVIYLNALSEVQGFSILKAIGNVIVAALLIGVVFGIVFGVSLHLMGASLEASQTALQFFQNLEIIKMI